MKMQKTAKTLIVALAGGLVLLAWQASAQNGVNLSAAPQPPDGATQILQLEQAKVSDSTIIAYVKNADNSYTLNASQILYLRQKGVSDAVLTAMLNQPKVGTGEATAPTPAASTPEPLLSSSIASTTAVSAVAVEPAVTYVQTAPMTYYYYAPYYYPPHRYYAWPHPVVGVGWGRCGGWHVGVAW